MKIYVAGSCKNAARIKEIVAELRVNHEVYDFTDPKNDGNSWFTWREINEDWHNWTFDEFKIALEHPRAKEGFQFDLDGMKWADACLLVLPCGKSAHLELGWFAGLGKLTVIYANAYCEPELMYKLADHVVSKMVDVHLIFDSVQKGIAKNSASLRSLISPLVSSFFTPPSPPVISPISNTDELPTCCEIVVDKTGTYPYVITDTRPYNINSDARAFFAGDASSCLQFIKDNGYKRDINLCGNFYVRQPRVPVEVQDKI